MTNHETPSDLQGFRRTEAGYFAAPAPVLASATASTEQTNVRDRKTASAQRTLTGRMGVQDASGVVRESARQTATKGESSTSHSRGGRSNSDFAGGGSVDRHADKRDRRQESAVCPADRTRPINDFPQGVTEYEPTVIRPVASNSIQGRWGERRYDPAESRRVVESAIARSKEKGRWT